MFSHREQDWRWMSETRGEGKEKGKEFLLEELKVGRNVLASAASKQLSAAVDSFFLSWCE